jgi:hypothetical protein
MGADADIFVFDHTSYVESVVPSFRHLLLTTQPESWLRDIAQNPALYIELKLDHPTDLVGYCTYLSPYDLSWNGAYEGSRLDWDWQTRACQSTECPERFHCPFHRGNAEDDVSDLLHLFEMAVAAKCLGPSQFIGRSIDITFYDDLLSRLGIGSTDPIRRLLTCLGRRGFIVGYQWVNSDGIHGWLDYGETRELFQCLEVLDLPRYEATFKAMEAFRVVKPGPFDDPEVPFDALSLSFIRTVANIATQSGKGILWGNDVLFPEDYVFTTSL